MIIGLNGKAGAGKDTVANFLVEGFGFERYAFADAVRDAALAINPVIMTNWETVEIEEAHNTGVRLRELRLAEYIKTHGWDWSKRNIPEIRRLLQVIGTEMGRQVLGENCWVDLVDRKIKASGNVNAVITDLRFPNEAQYVRSLNGKIVLIVRPDNPDSIGASHASEQYTPEPDYVLNNDGSLWKLERLVDDMFMEFTGARS